VTDYPALLSAIDVRLREMQAHTEGAAELDHIDQEVPALVGWALERCAAWRRSGVYPETAEAERRAIALGILPEVESMARALGLLPKEGE
jgi:hypothetical protein